MATKFSIWQRADDRGADQIRLSIPRGMTYWEAQVEFSKFRSAFPTGRFYLAVEYYENFRQLQTENKNIRTFPVLHPFHLKKASEDGYLDAADDAGDPGVFAPSE